MCPLFAHQQESMLGDRQNHYHPPFSLPSDVLVMDSCKATLWILLDVDRRVIFSRPPAHQCSPRQTNHCCFAKTKWPPSVRAQWHLHLLSDKPLKVWGKISALSVHIKSLISLHQHSLAVLLSRRTRHLKMDYHTKHFDFITTRHWIFIYFF